jgi:hypothetical protein
MKQILLHEDIYYVYKEIQEENNYKEVKVVYKNFKDYLLKNNIVLEKDRDDLIYFEGNWYPSVNYIKNIIFDRLPCTDIDIVIKKNLTLFKDYLKYVQKGKSFFVWKGDKNVLLYFSHGEEIISTNEYLRDIHKLENRYGKAIVFENTYKYYSIAKRH